MKKQFKLTCRKSEKIIGLITIPVHALILPVAILYVIKTLNLTVSYQHRQLIHFTLSFIIILAGMMNFLRVQFSDFIGGFFKTIQAVLLGYALYFVIGWVLLKLLSIETYPTAPALFSELRKDTRIMTVVLIVLAPIVEETIFRGALFGTVRQKSRSMAYISSVLLFSIYMLCADLITGFTPDLIVQVLEYAPAGIALCWCYEKSGTVWASILLQVMMKAFILLRV